MEDSGNAAWAVLSAHDLQETPGDSDLLCCGEERAGSGGGSGCSLGLLAQVASLGEVAKASLGQDLLPPSFLPVPARLTGTTSAAVSPPSRLPHLHSAPQQGPQMFAALEMLRMR